MKNGSNSLPKKLACWPGVTLPSRKTCGNETNDGTARSSAGLSLATVLP